MTVTTDVLEQKIKELEEQETKLVAQLNALSGAKQAYQLLLREMTQEGAEA